MKRVKAFYKANNFPWVTFKRYWKHATVSELLFDVFIPLCLAIVLVYFASLSVSNLKVLIESFRNISGQVIAAISILAGFNIASITILATISSGPTELLRKKRSSDGSLSLYDMLINFFTWAVVIQLIVVLLSIFLYYIGSFIPTEIEKQQVPLWAWVLASMWLTVTIHSIFLSIRNMKTLYLYVTYKETDTEVK